MGCSAWQCSITLLEQPLLGEHLLQHVDFVVAVPNQRLVLLPLDGGLGGLNCSCNRMDSLSAKHALQSYSLTLMGGRDHST